MSRLQSGTIYKDIEMSGDEGHEGTAPQQPAEAGTAADRMALMLEFLVEDRRKRD